MNKIEGIPVDEISFYIPNFRPGYLKRFKAVSNGKWTFNFCSAIVGEFWFAYHFLLFEYLIILILDIIASAVINIYFRCQFISPHDAVLMIFKASLLFLLIKMILFGFIGDRLLWRSIKKRIKRDDETSGHFNLLDKVLSQIESSEKRGLARGVAVVISIGLLYLASDNIVSMIIAKFFY